MKDHKYKRFYPIGLISLIGLPIVLVYYLHLNDLTRPHCLEAYAKNGFIDYFGGVTRFDLTRNDFPHSQKLNELLRLCAVNDSLKHSVSSIVIVSLSRNCSYLDFIWLLDTLQSTEHYATFFNTGAYFYVEYRTRQMEDRADSNAIAYAKKLPLFRPYYQPVSPSETSYASYVFDVFAQRKAYYLILLLWIVLFGLNFDRIIKHRQMRRLTSRSS